MLEQKEKEHCKYLVVRKKRYCKMTVKPGEEFCGEHQKPEEDSSKMTEGEKVRILCPLDKKHTCYAHNLQKHLKICNARNLTAEPYILKDVNSGKSSEIDSDDSYKLLSSFPKTDVLNVIEKINKVYVEHCKDDITTKILTHELLEEEMKNPDYGDKTKKHLKQASSILGLLNEYNLLRDDTCYIEFGAGRGQLSFWIAKATDDKSGSNILLVERASPKHKRDNKLSKTMGKVKRLRADISDLVLDKVESVSNSKHIVGVTKHLCGEATDLALRCMANMDQNKEKMLGSVLTFCCHHRCKWTPYSGKEFFQNVGLTKNDFDIMCGVASWATCGTGFSRERRKKCSEGEAIDQQNIRDNELGLTREEKEEIGRRCKNVINWGRLVFLETYGFKCTLHYYTEKCITLENVCIVAYKPIV